MGAFALDASRITWTERAPAYRSELWRIAKDGGAPTHVVALEQSYEGVTAVGGGASWVWGLYTRIGLVTSANAVSELWEGVPGNTVMMIADGPTVFVAAEYGIFRMESPYPVPLVARRAFALTFDSSDFYFTDYTVPGKQPFVTDKGTLWRAPKAGGAPIALLTNPGLLGGLRLDGDKIYVADRIDGTVLRVNKDGTGVVTVGVNAAGEQAIGLAVDDACVYWSASAGDGAPSHVYAAPK